MIKSIEATGKTKDDALASALRTLGLTADDVTYEVLDMGKAGFFGFGAQPARIKVSYEVPGQEPEEPKAAPEKKEVREEKQEKPRAPKAKKEKAPAPVKEAAPVPQAEQNEKTARVEQFLTGLFERMGVDAQPAASWNSEDGSVSVTLRGGKVGALIGRRGETLDAIQHLCNYVLNSGENERTRVNIDAENYRAKRASALTGLAKKTAAKVVRYRRNMTLEPMNAYERHVIHTALQDFEGVTTYSTGTEPNRRVVVAYERSGNTAERPEGQERRPRRERGGRSERPNREVRAEPKTEEPVAETPAPAKKEHVTREWC